LSEEDAHEEELKIESDPANLLPIAIQTEARDRKNNN